MIPLQRLLNPGQNPVLDSVHIPLANLEERIFELPPKFEEVLVADVEALSIPCKELLESKGRIVRIAFDWLPGIPTPGRLWKPNSFVEEYATSNKPGKCLDLGCGSGRDSVFLAGCGWSVTALDHLPDALLRGRSLALQHGVEVDWIERSLRQGLADLGRFDLILLMFAPFAAILSDIHNHLSPAGIAVIETFETNLPTSAEWQPHQRGDKRTSRLLLRF